MMGTVDEVDTVLKKVLKKKVKVLKGPVCRFLRTRYNIIHYIVMNYIKPDQVRRKRYIENRLIRYDIMN